MIVELQGIHLTYQSKAGEIEALRDVNFGVQAGEFVSLVGPSGCGKSTLLSIIAGLERPTEGQVIVDGTPVSAPTRDVGYMPQKDQLFPWRTIWKNVILGLELTGQTGKEHLDNVRSLLHRYGLADFAQKPPRELSGGMRQRCALIRTLATHPKILLLDEPFSALDYQTRLEVSADIRAIIAKEKKTAILVTHDISEAVSLSDRVVVLTRRPGTVKNIHSLETFQGILPEKRREHPDYKGYFNNIWKELELHE